MEDAILSRWGLLGLAVLVLLRFGPPILDRMSRSNVQHLEIEDRKDEKVTNAFIDQVQRGEIEREKWRTERGQFLAAQDAFRLQLAQFERVLIVSNETLITFNTSITEIKQVLKDIKTTVKDFDSRMVLYLKSQEKRP